MQNAGVFSRDFADNTVIPQYNYEKSCRTPSHSLATHFYTCLPVVFTTNDFVHHLSNSLTFNVSGISSLILKCLFPQDAACLMYFACHFLRKTTLSPWFPIIKLPPKSAKGCHDEQATRKAAVSARVPPRKLQVLHECFLQLELFRFEADPLGDCKTKAQLYNYLLYGSPSAMFSESCGAYRFACKGSNQWRC